MRELPTTLPDGGPGYRQRDIFRAKYEGGVATGADPVGELDLASADDEWPVLSADKKIVFFASNRVDGVPASSKFNVWMARRESTDGPFDPPVPVEELNSEGDDAPRTLSKDGCRIYLRSDRAGRKAIYMAERPR